MEIDKTKRYRLIGSDISIGECIHSNYMMMRYRKHGTKDAIKEIKKDNLLVSVKAKKSVKSYQLCDPDGNPCHSAPAGDGTASCHSGRSGGGGCH